MLPNDLKDYEAPTIWRLHRDKAWMAVAVALWVWAMLIPLDSEARKPAQAVKVVLMPPAPYFEQRHELMRLTPPVFCVRLDGIEGMGRQWIRQWGDGDLPPVIPTCVNAERAK